MKTKHSGTGPRAGAAFFRVVRRAAGAFAAAALVAAFAACGDDEKADPTSPPSTPAGVDITYSVSANNLGPGDPDTNLLSFSFSADPGPLSGSDISVGGVASPSGGLSGSGAYYTLPVSVGSAGSAVVWVTKSGVEGGGKTVAVHKAGSSTTDKTWTVTANGEANNTSSTMLTFTFSGNPLDNGLTVSDITVGGAAAISGAFIQISLTQYTLAITPGAQGNATVSISKPGISPGPYTVPVHKRSITYTVSANNMGGPNEPDSDLLTFTFSADPGAVAAANINVYGQAAKNGAIAGSGQTRTLPVTTSAQGDANVIVTFTDVEGGMKTVPVHKRSITYSVSANGDAGSQDSTMLTFNFSADPGALAAGDITITAGTGAATKGTLGGTGTVRTLGVSGITQGSVTVSVAFASAGVEAGPKTVQVYKKKIGYTLSQDGSGSAATTKLIFTLPENPAPTALAATHIATVAGGTGAVTLSSPLVSAGPTTWTLPVTAVGTAGSINVKITHPDMDDAVKQVTVYRAPATYTATPDGTLSTVTTKKLTLVFADPVPYLSAGDITITNAGGAATKGGVSQTAPNTWDLAVSGVTAGNVTVQITRAGIAPAPVTSATALHKDTTAPFAAASLAASPGAPGQIVLTWADPASADLDHLEITHDKAGGSAPRTVAKGAQGYTWTGLSNANGPHTFTIKAVDAEGNVNTGATVTATPAP
jgi:hypothetical protein